MPSECSNPPHEFEQIGNDERLKNGKIKRNYRCWKCQQPKITITNS